MSCVPWRISVMKMFTGKKTDAPIVTCHNIQSPDSMVPLPWDPFCFGLFHCDFTPLPLEGTEPSEEGGIWG